MNTVATAFLVEHYVSRARADDLADLTAGLADAAARQVAVGRSSVQVAYSILVPDDELCLYAVRAVSAKAVAETAALASINVERIVGAAVLASPAVDFVPGRAGGEATT